ncbi:rhomboid domain-containing protein 1 [Nannochloropsis gaditana]|uniref:Rhomboid domain-containing protein 1 n=1 Tax=Nannochloropsis gaditana TaxID=72520 RepID=W7TRZ2_9STRA|nr:rhomboid domain-containing protein 1 [Nannochloropsis gaditana]
MYGPPYRPRGRPYPRQGRRNNDSYIIYVLLSTIFRYINELEYKPPVTIAFLTLNIMVHLMPEFFLPWGFDFRSVRDICLLPAHILELLPSLSSLFSSVQGDTLGRGLGRGGRNRPRSGNVWAEFIRNNFSSYRSSSAWWSPSMHDRWREAASRIFLSALVHGDDVHLYYNMLSLLYKGATLERALGSLPFLRLVFFAWGVSHTLILLLATFLHSLSFPSSSFYSCSVGFSAVLFALKYVSYARDPDSWTTVAGFRVPLGKASWVELVVTSFLTPNASFLGHLCGILAGILIEPEIAGECTVRDERKVCAVLDAECTCWDGCDTERR